MKLIPGVLFLALFPFIGCDLLIQEDGGATADHPDVSFAIYPTPTSGVESTVDCLVSFGEWDEWEYRWDLPDSEYIEEHEGSRIKWLVPENCDEFAVRVVVSNDTLSMEELSIVPIQTPQTPVVSIRSSCSSCRPEWEIRLDAIAEDNRFPLTYLWTTDKGSVIDEAGQHARIYVHEAGPLTVHLQVSNSRYSADVETEIEIRRVAPQIMSFGTDWYTDYPRNSVIVVYMDGLEENHDEVSIQWSASGLVIEETTQSQSGNSFGGTCRIKSGSVPGEYQISAEVGDGYNTASESIVIQVME